MILRSGTWRFIEKVHDTGFYLDELVEHLGTGYRARRRTFSQKITRDPVALREVERQGQLLAKVQRHSIPRILMAETVEDQYSIVHEFVPGTSLLELSAKGRFSSRGTWTAMALRIVEELQRLSDFKVEYDRLRLASVVLSPQGELRFDSVWAMGHARKKELDASPMLLRMHQSPYGGLYVGSGDSDPVQSLLGLKTLLFHMAVGRDARTIEQALEDERRDAERMGSMLAKHVPLDVEKGISDLLLSLHRDGPAKYPNLASVHAALKELAERPAGAEELNAQRNAATPSFDTGAMPDAPKPIPARHSSPAVALAPVATGAAVPADPGTGDASLPKSSALDYVKVEKEFEGEAPEYLYPTAPNAAATGVSAAAAASPVAGGSSLLVGAGAAPARPIATGGALGPLLAKLALAVVVLAIVGGAGVFLYVRGTAKPPNRPPVAVIADGPATVPALAKAEFSAAGSQDPDGDSLSYRWSVLGTEPSNYRIAANDSQIAFTTEVQFFVTGKFEVQLVVWDGLALSPPVTRAIEVTPAKR